MAFVIGDKTYTDHPMLDEICYNCKKILKNIVIKNDVYAGQCETENSVTDAEVYSIMKDRNGFVSFELFPFNEEILYAYGYSLQDVRDYMEDKYRIPEADRASLTTLANNMFKDRFFDANSVPIGEENDYYRNLYGLPPFDTGKDFYIPIDPNILTEYSCIGVQNADGNYYLHEQNKKSITVLYSTGYIDKLKKTYTGSGYSYMNHLGDKSIDILTARKAAKWDILYMPNVYYLVEDRFTEFYRINREMYANRSYQEYYAEIGEYYDEMMIIIVLSQTFADMVTSTPEWYIRRDVFDLRSCQYFLDSYGVKYFKQIPLKYQIKIVRNLNKLIKYKSTNANIDDILDIFKSNDTQIYKYWLYKKRNLNADGSYVDTGDPEVDYDLEFISSDINDSYDSYIKDKKYRTPYDDITLQDKYWDGEQPHDQIKNKILQRDFTIEGTKYMSIEYTVPNEDYAFQMEYFLGLIKSSSIDTSRITIPIPSIDDTARFSLSNLFLFLEILTTCFYMKNEDIANGLGIRYPEEWEGPLPPVNEDFYDWKKKYMPEVFQVKNGRVYGYNPDVNLEELYKTMEKRHSHLRFGSGDTPNAVPRTDSEYKIIADEWIDSLGIYDYIIPTTTVDEVEDLVNIYNNNKEIYIKLKEAIYNADTYDDKKLLEYAFQELFTRKFDKAEYYISDGDNSWYSNDLIEVLQYRDYVLWSTFNRIMTESSMEARQDAIRSIMNDVIDTLEYYFQGFGLNYLFSFTTTEGFDAIVQYLYLMIGFFKSYKVYFLDPYVTYKIGNGELSNLENSVKAIDNINEWLYEYLKSDKAFSHDRINGFNIEMLAKDNAYDIDNQREDMDMYVHYDPDPLSDLNYDGKNASEGQASGYTDLDGGVARTESNYPYITVNGGSSYLGMIDWNDLNGGWADESYKDYYIIDGGYAYHVDDRRTDYMGSQMFNYIIDGGSAHNRRFISNTLDIYMGGNTIYANVIISPRVAQFIKIEIHDTGKYNFGDLDDITGEKKAEDGFYDFGTTDGDDTDEYTNMIVDDEDYDFDVIAEEYDPADDADEYQGLYMDETYWANVGDFYSLVYTVDEIRDQVQSKVSVIELELIMLSDTDTRTQQFSEWIDETLYPFYYVLDEMNGDAFKHSMEAAIDQMASALAGSFTQNDLNPFGWEDL